MIYGLPKIRKEHVPLRPIVSCIGSPSYPLSKHIAKLITPLAGRTNSYIRNSEHFIRSIKDVVVDGNELLVSFDVCSLFTNVPIGEAVSVIHEMLLEDESLEDRTVLSADVIADLLNVCLRSTYFCYKD